MGESKTYKIGYVILLSDEITNKVRDIQTEIIKNNQFISSILNPPHITIKRPIEVEDIEKYENILDQLAGSISNDDVQIKGYHFFSDKVFFLDVIESEHLIQIHNLLLSMLENEGIEADEMEGENQRFHSTIANGDISSELLEILKKDYSGKKLAYKFKIKELAILRHTGTHWIVHKKAFVR